VWVRCHGTTSRTGAATQPLDPLTLVPSRKGAGVTRTRRPSRAGRRDRQPDCSTYEFVVAGALGPVLRHALSPQRTAQTQSCTVLRAEVAEDTDLVDVVRILESKGVKFEGVFAIGTQ
jgi:hypothetical protein